MSRVVSGSDSLTIVPSGYTGLTSLTTTTSYPVSNGYTASGSTTYARFTLSSGSTGYLYYTFDTSAIPSGATISSVTCTVTARVSSTSRVTSTQCQLYSGTTAKGSNSTFASTSSTNTVTLTTGTWTLSELSDLRLKIGGTGSSGSGGGGSSRYIYFYGATVTITYSYNFTVYEITLTNNAGITTDPSSDGEVDNGSDYILSLYNDGADITVTDNGTDVTSQLVETAPASGGTVTFVPASYTTDGSISGTYYQSAVGQGSDTSNTSSGNNYSSGGSSSTAYIDYAFDISDIPSNATITAISCSVKGKAESTTMDSTHYAKVVLCLDGTAISDEGQFSSTTDSVIIVTATTLPTVSELSDLTLRFMIAYYGGNMCGATLSITYTVPTTGNNYFVYTITSVSADHVIVVNTASSAVLYYKSGGTWIAVSKVYKKVGGIWVEQSDITAIFDSNVNYVRAN